MTKVKEKKVQMVQLTTWSSPKSVINTQYGWCTVQRWNEHEQERITKDGDRVAELRYRETPKYKKDSFINPEQVSLWVDDITEGSYRYRKTTGTGHRVVNNRKGVA